MNGLEGGHYAEPFAGGAAVALAFLFSERVRHIHINDIDPCLYAFWHSAVFDTEAMIARIAATDVSVEAWLAAREVKRNPADHSAIDLGFATFFLSRTNRSGILNGGMIGGLEQRGAWKLDCRFNKPELISRIHRVGFFRSRISVTNMDGAAFISEYLPRVPKNSLVYIDPPYYVKGAYLYHNHYKHENHVDLAKLVSRIDQHKWIVSYDNVDEIKQMYRGFDQEQFNIDYTARSYSRGAEVMVFSPELRRPRRVYCSDRERKLFAAQEEMA